MKNFLFAFFAMLTVLFSCSKNESENVNTEEDALTSKIPEKFDNVLKSLNQAGWNTDNMLYDKNNDVVIYDDMAFYADTKFPEGESDTAEANRANWSGNWVSYSQTKDVKYYIDPVFAPKNSMEVAMDWASWYWSQASSNISIERTYNHGESDILVSGQSGSGTGYALFPSGDGNVGNRIVFSNADTASLSWNEKLALAVHEIGHTLGFSHANNPPIVGGWAIGSCSGSSTYHGSSNCGSIMRSPHYTCGWAYDHGVHWTDADVHAIDWAYGFNWSLVAGISCITS